jgi:TetR/AcrR family transcriptional regulator, transcriptional repressor for nem operon
LGGVTSEPKTERGRASRAHIVDRAAELVAGHGVQGTSLDDVLVAAGASKSQLYHYFADKHGLVEAVVEYQSAAVLAFQAQALASVHNWEDLEGWTDEMVAMVERQGSRGGCPIGTLAAAVADTDETLRELLSDAFQAWRDTISGALERLRDNQLLARDADIYTLTTITLAAIEGGLLLAKTTRDSTQLRIALDGVIAHLRAHAPARPKRATQTHAPAARKRRRAGEKDQ